MVVSTYVVQALGGCAVVGLSQLSSVVQSVSGEDVLTITLPDGVEMKFRRIPAGSFTMGSPSDEKDRESDEGPQHKVTISKPFYLGMYEVTQVQWKEVMGEIREHSGFHGSNYDNPMQSTSWSECQEFVKRINRLGVGKFCLPTEAQWEYACRAGTTTRYYWGDDPDESEIDDYAWYDLNADGESHEVAQRKPNPWGLYDMSGNVDEWCQDWYGDYGSEPETDPQGPKSGSSKVFRGGEWYNPSQNCRSAYRGKLPPDTWGYFVGLRLVMECP